MTDVVRVWGADQRRRHPRRADAREPLSHVRPRAHACTAAASTRDADWEEAIRLASTGAVPVGPLVSRRIPLEDLQKGMEEALAGGPVMKVLVDLG